MILIDSNVLIRSSAPRREQHPILEKAIGKLLADEEVLVVSSQSIYEFWSVMTRPREQNGFGLSPREARAEIDQLRLSFFRAEDPANLCDIWLDLVTVNEVKGKMGHDARLVAFMIGTQIKTLLTLNKPDFSRYSEIHAISPEDVLSGVVD